MASELAVFSFISILFLYRTRGKKVTFSCLDPKCPICNNDIQEIKDQFVIFNKDLRSHASLLLKLGEEKIKRYVFFGCELGAALEFCSRYAQVFPPFKFNAPYKPYRSHVYTIEELYNGFDINNPKSYLSTPDARIAQRFVQGSQDFLDAFAKRVHDSCITEAINQTLGSINKCICAIMGGHNLARGTEQYYAAAKISRALTRAGLLCISGGGPGAMEACNLGVWFSERSEDELEEAIQMLSKAPLYTDEFWLSVAFQVRARFPLENPEIVSFGIPTFYYGHEPPNVFQTHVAKYFANSIREDALLSVAFNGIIYFEGSAGTVSEVFADACQNHYEIYGASPMIFYGTEFWTRKLPAYELLKIMSDGKPYHNLVSLCNNPEEVVDTLLEYFKKNRRIFRSLSATFLEYKLNH